MEKIGIDNNFRREKIGTLLMNEIKENAKKLGCERVELSCWSFNASAINFYKSIGMKIQKMYMELNCKEE